MNPFKPGDKVTGAAGSALMLDDVVEPEPQRSAWLISRPGLMQQAIIATTGPHALDASPYLTRVRTRYGVEYFPTHMLKLKPAPEKKGGRRATR